MQKIIAIAASTGGVEALDYMLPFFPESTPPVLVVIHMHEGFTRLFAQRMKSRLAAQIKEAESGDVLQKGRILIAPAGRHMRLVRKGSEPIVDCFLGPKVNAVIPAADILFDSVADIIGANAVGVVLTGMGRDGADGLLKMRQNGARTLGQDKATSAIYGMPKVAFDIGAVEAQLPLNQIVSGIFKLV